MFIVESVDIRRSQWVKKKRRSMMAKVRKKTLVKMKRKKFSNGIFW
jgi:hypothetical protein